MRSRSLASSRFALLGAFAALSVGLAVTGCDSGPATTGEPGAAAGTKASGGNGQSGAPSAKGGSGPVGNGGSSQSGGSGPVGTAGSGPIGGGASAQGGGPIGSAGTPGVAGNGSGNAGNGSGNAGNGSGNAGNGSGNAGNGSGNAGNGSGNAGNGSGNAGAGSGNTGGSSSGKFCGGIAGIECGKGEFCNLEGAKCGIADAGGICTKTPEGCSKECQKPGVCGCDGQRYCSACVANQKGVSVADESFCGGGPDLPRACGTKGTKPCFAGEICDRSNAKTCGEADEPGVCKVASGICTEECQSPGVCGCDGQRHCSACQANAKGVSVAPSESYCKDTDPPLRACGTKGTKPCLDGEFCDRAQAKSCGEFDEPGVCRSQPDSCSKECQVPGVCGCDGERHCSACQANAAGVSVAPSETYCKKTDPGIRACGTKGTAACFKGELCDRSESKTCGEADEPGICRDLPDGCSKECQVPGICGCDGQRYCSKCVAELAGTSAAPNDSYCGTVGKTCGGKIGIQCGEGEYCNFPPEAICGQADGTGVCEKKAIKCSTACDFVAHCGCDGVAYCNACALSKSGVSEAPSLDFCKGQPQPFLATTRWPRRPRSLWRSWAPPFKAAAWAASRREKA